MVKFKIEWSIEARLDVVDILDFYIKRNGSSTYSRKVYKRINHNIQLIAKNPHIGVKTDDPDVRALITGDYQIIYEIIEKGILIDMVWDSRRNPIDNRYIKK